MGEVDRLVCACCGATKVADAFPVDKRNRSGRDSWCRDCRRSYDRSRAERKRRAQGVKAAKRYDDAPGFKTCRKCGEVKPLDAFYADRSGVAGVHARCKSCVSASRLRTHGPLLPDGHKRCTGCCQIKPVDDFHRSASGAQGRVSRCKVCVAGQQRQRRMASRPAVEPVPDGHKRCPMCEDVKPLDAFHRNSARADGVDTYCRDCSRVRKGHQQRIADPAPEGHKTCATCSTIKPLDEFHPDRRATRGASGSCRDCRNATSAARRREVGIPERPTFPDGDGLKTCRRCRESKPVEEFSPEVRNRDGLRSWCDPCARRRTLEWHTDNPAAISNLKAVRRGAVEAGRLSERDWQRLVERHGRCCAYCGRPSERLAMDHVIPVTRHGRHFIGNLLPVCQSCNSSKGDRLLIEWRYRARTRLRLTINAKPANQPRLP